MNRVRRTLRLRTFSVLNHIHVCLVRSERVGEVIAGCDDGPVLSVHGDSAWSSIPGKGHCLCAGGIVGAFPEIVVREDITFTGKDLHLRLDGAVRVTRQRRRWSVASD